MEKYDPPQYGPTAGISYVVPPPQPVQTSIILTQPSSTGTANVAYLSSNGTLQNPNVVVINQRLADKPVPLSGTGRNWNHALISDCCDDCCVGALGYFCTPCMLCCIYHSMDELTYCVAFLGCTGSAILARAKIRTALHIKGSFCGDICCSIWCHKCVACQMYKELREAGQLKGNCCYCGCDSEKQCLCT